MNKRTQRLLLDWLIAVVLAIAIGYVVSFSDYTRGLFLVSLIWLALRHGPYPTLLAGFVAGGVLKFLISRPDYWVDAVVYGSFPILFVALAGLFARNTQRTLNNRRLSSTYLNITTASFLVSLVWHLLRFWLIPLVLDAPSPIGIQDVSFWVSAVLSALVSAGVLCLMAQSKASLIIPKRTKYLTRRETSSLLND